MDYKEKYESALERAKVLMTKGYDILMPEIFPELAESEDERIRKELIGALMWQRDNLKAQGPHDNKLILPGFTMEVGDILDWLERQKEQKSIIQDVELNDAVYDYVRDHFIAGADFTPEYIKKLMENAFFAGVDYYLLKQESESCEPDTNVEKVIEDVIRIYGKTQGEWVGGYDVDTLIVNLRRAFNKKEQKQAENTCGACCDDERFEIIAQAKKDIIEKTNIAENELSMELPLLEGILMRVWQVGWLNKKPAEWSEGDVYNIVERLKIAYDETKNEMFLEDIERIKSLRPQSHWKPSEEQVQMIRMILTDEAMDDNVHSVLESLYEDLKKLKED